MITTYGFYLYAGFADNSDGTTAKFGELSNLSNSFSREIGKYTDTASPKTALSVFSALDEDGAKQVLPSDTSIRILQIGQWLLDRAAKGDITADRDQLLQYLNEDFQDYIEDADCTVPETNGTLYLPTWISYTLTATGDKVKVWLSDSVFQAQYPLYEYVCVPPIPADQLDTFFGDYDTLKDLVESRDDEERDLQLDEATDPYPYTRLWSKFYTAYNFADESLTVPTLWTIAIYGAAGNNIDNIKEWLQDWILDHSTHDRPDWEIVLPDLFIPTEHMCIPIWNEHSAPELTNQARIYSPIIDDATIPEYLTNFVTGYGDVDVVRQSLQEVPTLFQSLPFLAVGNPRNRDGILKFRDRWPQYALITMTSLDINRIDEDTRKFIAFLFDMLKMAQDLTSEDAIPVGYSRVTRGDNTYIAKSYDDVQYIFLTRESFLAIMPDADDSTSEGLRPGAN